MVMTATEIISRVNIDLQTARQLQKTHIKQVNKPGDDASALMVAEPTAEISLSM